MERYSNKISIIESESLMQKLLPPKNELRPISQSNTFGECSYISGSFDEQPLEIKLEVTNSIVRQANRINYYPTPESEKVLSGDCTTTGN